MIGIPYIYDFNINPILGWSLTTIGVSIFSIAATEFIIKRKEKIVTSGLYSKVRHPQYLGIILATLGFTITSERPIAWISWLNLTFLYVLLASIEEKLLQDQHGEKIKKYIQKVPLILPTPLFTTSKWFRLPEKKIKKYIIILFIYLIVMIVAWVILKQFSYNPGPFWE
ncbi:MAG: methyltransferase [Candidatus Bathyarchaeota archaeon]